MYPFPGAISIHSFELESIEIMDSFESDAVTGVGTPQSKRKLRKGSFWTSRENSEEMFSSMGDDSSTSTSGRSSRRSSIVSLLQRRMSSRGQDSFDSCSFNTSDAPLKVAYRVVVLGSSKVGKTAILSQFLYDSFVSGYQETVDEMYHGEFDVGGCELALKIQDTGGNYVDEFPAMVEVSLASADAVLIVYSVDDLSTFKEVSRLRDLAHSVKGESISIVVVGNKTDLEREVSKEEAEAIVSLDWENGYIECCAKDNINITEVFQEILIQTKNRFNFSNYSKTRKGSNSNTPVMFKRRQSLPQVPAFKRLVKVDIKEPLSEKRSQSIGTTRRESCKIQ